jgi:hypothetical protein
VARWGEVRAAAPELAAAVQRCFDAHKHKTIATLRRDGSPRISGNEVTFTPEEVWIGIMNDAVRVLDLQRDPRLAVHSATVDPEMAGGDAKLSGRAVEAATAEEFARILGDDEAGPGSFHLFRIDVAEVVRTSLGDPADHLVVESWHPGRGYERVHRS